MCWRIIVVHLVVILPFTAASQDDDRHRDRPVIVGQDEIITNEDEPVTIRLSDLEVETDSWWYPWGFSLELHKGEHYEVNDNTVFPRRDFHGILTVPVTVRDGDRKSAKYGLRVEVRPVNDPPLITSQTDLGTPEEESITISINHLNIHDPDSHEFTMEVADGSHFSRAGNSITPGKDFNGTLRVPVRVADAEAYSDWYELKINVTPVNDPPVITGQNSMQADQHETFAIPLESLEVKDPDDDYPRDFSLKILPSENNTYTASANHVTPSSDFAGALVVRIRVNDGQTDSETFGFKVTIIRVNDAPDITSQREVTIPEDGTYTIALSDITVSDSDNAYPDGFMIKVLKGADYSAEGNRVTPVPDFAGPLSVNIVANDGYEDGSVYPFRIDVQPVNDPPIITNFEEEPLDFDAGVTLPVTEVIEVDDVDDDSLSQAVIYFHPPRYRPGVDQLLSDRSTEVLDVAFDVARGTMTLTGDAPISEYVAQIRSVRYNRVAAYQGPDESKIIFIQVSDGEATSKRVERIVNGDDIIVDLDIPTAFTPNGDMANDTWIIRPLKNSDKLGDAVIRVYNTGGYLLFETTGFEQAWDGSLDGEALPSGTYYYTIEFNPAVSRTRYRGIVAILR